MSDDDAALRRAYPSMFTEGDPKPKPIQSSEDWLMGRKPKEEEQAEPQELTEEEQLRQWYPTMDHDRKEPVEEVDPALVQAYPSMFETPEEAKPSDIARPGGYRIVEPRKKKGRRKRK